MAYEIPQQLQHKEKIIFGLTFSQLGWAVLTLFVVLIIFKTNFHFNVQLFLASIPVMIGIAFMFFHLNNGLKYLLHFMRFRTITKFSVLMKKFLEINKIEDSVVYTDKKIAYIEVTPLNYNIKTYEEKETIMRGFQKFLNGLDFPIQISVNTINLNLDDYMSKLEKRMKCKKQFKQFSEFIDKTITENKIMTRNFYIIIPENSNLEIQCSLCIERLRRIGLKAKRLEDNKILECLKIYAGVEKTKSPPSRIKIINWFKKKFNKEIKDAILYLIAPSKIKDNVDSFYVNDTQMRVVSAVGYPRVVESGFLDKIISSNDDFDISIHIEPFPIETMMINLNRELQKQRADLFAEKKNNSINPSLEIKHKDTLKVLENLQKGQEKLFNVSLYINCKGKTKEELDFLTKKVEAELNSIMVLPYTPYFRQLSGFKSMMPLAKDDLKIRRNITTGALSAFFPFTSPFLTLEEKGVMLGLNKNKIPYIKDIFSLSNANGIVLATSGSGKSYFTKLLISRQLMNGTQVLVVDPQAEYIGLTQKLDGELITISKDSKSMINPLDLMGHDYIEKRLILMDMFKIMFGDLSEIQKSILDRAINETYAIKKINANSKLKRKPPILGDLYETLQKMDRKASQMEKVTYRALLNRLYMYTEGVFSFMNKPTNIDFDNKFVCFNIGNMPKQVKPLVMFMILDYIYMKMKETKERKLLVVDEAWSLLSRSEEASYLFEIVKTCRKFNMGLLMITQDVSDLLNSKAGNAVLANSSYSFLLRQKPSVISSVVNTFNLSGMEKDYLLSATQGKGILIMDNDHQELEVVSSPEEHEVITTNADEIVEKKKKKKKEKKNNDIDLDLDRGLFFGKELDIEEKNYLGNHGYDVEDFYPIGANRQEECWVKKNKVESLGHTFLVQNIKLELLKHTKDIEVNITEKADIIFKNKKGTEYAIEIETGIDFKYHKKRLEDKFFHLIEKYKKRCFIVLTDSKMKSQYEGVSWDVKIMNRREIMEAIKRVLK